METGRVFMTKLSESPGYVDLNTLSLKTWQISLVEPTGSDMSSDDLPKSGTMRNGKLYERQTLVRPTEEQESGLWPTPRANPAMASTITPENCHDPKRFPNLETEVGRRMWPTPAASDNRDSGHMDNPAVKRRVEKGKQIGLTTAVKPHKMKGALNPEWVEPLMGFPVGWTELGKKESPESPQKPKTEPADLNASETP